MRRLVAHKNLEIDVHLEADGAPTSMADEVRAGLAGEPKSLPSKYFYDERGSRLFETITTLPEYYLTRAEEALLKSRGREIARVSRPHDLVELGSGAATKTRLLIDAGLAEGTLRRFVPVDVSERIAEHSSREIAAAYPQLEIRAVVADFEAHLERIPRGGRRLVAFLGSTIGNFPEREAVKLLRNIQGMVGPEDWFLFGTDLVKDTAVLEAAYNDSRGVTAEFNRNILNVINRHLDGNFDPGAFEHVAFYNVEKERIESYLRSSGRQDVRLGAIDLDVSFEAGELLWTEVSCKYTRSSVEKLLDAAALRMEHWIEDDDATFALSLSRV
jgi:L-histidine N-alpha-methyltransferase